MSDARGDSGRTVGGGAAGAGEREGAAGDWFMGDDNCATSDGRAFSDGRRDASERAMALPPRLDEAMELARPDGRYQTASYVRLQRIAVGYHPRVQSYVIMITEQWLDPSRSSLVVVQSDIARTV